MNSCPCGSGSEYATCCEPIIAGKKAAETAEQLMRARYSAHVKVALDFIFESTHPDYRKGYDHKGTRDWAENSDWYGIEILETVLGGAGDEEGEVVFAARFRDKDGLRTHRERAQFKRKNSQWFFTDGIMMNSQPISSSKVGRNDACPCGSGSKYKKCCGK